MLKNLFFLFPTISSKEEKKEETAARCLTAVSTENLFTIIVEEKVQAEAVGSPELR